MKRFKQHLELNDGTVIDYETEESDEMTIKRLVNKISMGSLYVVLCNPDGSVRMINTRYIKTIDISEVTDPA